VTRSAEEVFRDHGRAVNAGDLQAILADYADDAFLLTAQGVLKGKSGAETFFTQAFDVLPNVQVSAKHTAAAGDVVTVWWSAESPAGRIDDGVDTFVVENDLIKIQTISFTVQTESST
jgi:ketosteroid isomerase-like protein